MKNGQRGLSTTAMVGIVVAVVVVIAGMAAVVLKGGPGPSTTTTTTTTSTPTPTTTTTPGYTRQYPNLAPDDNMLIGAYYYPWYSATRHWGDGYKGSPVLGEYSCRDEETINTQIDWATGHGIDLFIMSWWGQNSWEDVTLKDYFLKASLATDIKFCIFYETRMLSVTAQDKVDLNNQANREQLIQDFKYIENTYFDEPGYLRINGRPVVAIYLARIFAGDVENAISELRSQLDENVYLIGDMVYWSSPDTTEQRTLMRQFDAVTSYNMHTSVPNIDDNFGGKVSGKYAEWLRVAGEEGVGFVPDLIPGFDDTAVRPEAGHPVIIRSPQRFENFCDEVLRYLDNELNAVFITSFNEWHEYTQIEPDNDYGTIYLEIVENKLAGFL